MPKSPFEAGGNSVASQPSDSRLGKTLLRRGAARDGPGAKAALGRELVEIRGCDDAFWRSVLAHEDDLVGRGGPAGGESADERKREYGRSHETDPYSR